jgi:inorganic triphosphatase YgiF
MTEEVELKLTVRPADVDAIFGLIGGEPAHIDQRATYYDTPDRVLASAGIALRIRIAGGRAVQTIKSAGDGAVGLFARGEWECAVALDATPRIDPATPAGAVLGDRTQDLAPVFTVAVDRRVWQHDHAGASIEIALDRGAVIAGDRRSDLCEVELELRSGEPAALFALARRIDVVAPVRLGVLTKSERGYRLLDAARGAVKAEPLILPADVTAGDAFAAAAFSCIRHFRLNEALLETAPDEAALHQARVALRRLRSALSIWRPLLADPLAPRLNAELRWLSGVLGDARNLDVLIGRLGTGALRDKLIADRGSAYAAAAAALASSRSRAALLALAEYVAVGAWRDDPLTADVRDQPAARFAATTLAVLRRKVKRRGRDLVAASDEERHDVRKDAKRLRYAAEFFGSVFTEGKQRRRHRRFVTALGGLQDQLGALNDLATAETMLLADPDVMTEIDNPDRKPRLIKRAAKAHAALLDAKRFWQPA